MKGARVFRGSRNDLTTEMGHSDWSLSKYDAVVLDGRLVPVVDGLAQSPVDVDGCLLVWNERRGLGGRRAKP